MLGSEQFDVEIISIAQMSYDKDPDIARIYKVQKLGYICRNRT